MGGVILDNILLTPLNRITVAGGDVLHAIKSTDEGFACFGEAYFSMIEKGAIKAWKMHKAMRLNLVVPIGTVRFVFYSQETRLFREEIIGISNYVRLTVPAGIWFGFQGVAESNLILNVASISHDPDEVLRMPVEDIQYDWSLN